MAIVAHLTFWVALLIGARDLGAIRVGVFLGLWTIGYVASRASLVGGFLFDSWVALLAVVLVLIVFRGDLRIR